MGEETTTTTTVHVTKRRGPYKKASQTEETTTTTTVIDLEEVTQTTTILEEETGETTTLKPLSDKEVIEQFLSDEGNRKMVMETALSMKKIFGGFWFDIIEMTQKTNHKTVPDALIILNLLKLGGKLVARMRENGKAEEYKVVLDAEAEYYVVEKELEFHKKMVEKYELDLVEVGEKKIKEAKEKAEQKESQK